MLKINSKIIILFFVAISPVFDIINGIIEINKSQSGITDFKLNQVFRVIFIIVLMLSITNYYYLRNLCLLGICLITNYVIQFTYGFSTNIITDIGFCLKLFLGFVLYYYFMQNFEKNRFDIKDIIHALVIAMYIMAFSVLLSYFGFGFRNISNGYRSYARGYFVVHNAVTAYCLILLPLIFGFYSKGALFFNLLVCSFVLLSMGTKTGVVGLLLILVVIGIKEVVFLLRSVAITKGKLIALIMFGTLACIFVIIFVPQYIQKLLTGVKVETYYNSLYSFAVSNRNVQNKIILDFYKSLNGSFSGLYARLVGMGYSFIEALLKKNYSSFRMVEQDYFGVYFYFGILIFIFISVISIKACINAFKLNKVENHKNNYNFFIKLAFFAGLIHAFFGGHVLYESMSMIPFYMILAYLNREFNQKNLKSNSLTIEEKKNEYRC